MTSERQKTVSDHLKRIYKGTVLFKFQEVTSLHAPLSLPNAVFEFQNRWHNFIDVMIQAVNSCNIYLSVNFSETQFKKFISRVFKDDSVTNGSDRITLWMTFRFYFFAEVEREQL